MVKTWRVLGVDPGLASLGWGVIETDGQRHRLIESGTLRTTAKSSSGERLALLTDGIDQIISRFDPREGALENLYFAKNVSSALPVAQARGVILLQMYRRGLRPLGEYTPPQIKQALVGNGRASKDQVMDMVKLFLNLAQKPVTDHEADALAAAVTHIHWAEGSHVL